jgi:sugar/nucleoside kinase (ribokinase family)
MPRLALQGPAVIVRRLPPREFFKEFPMPSARYDVLGIGNAIVDVIARTEEDFLLKQGMRKGTMALIDEARAQAIYDAMGPAVEMSGGSAANTIVGVASSARAPPFVGKVKDDQLGRAFSPRHPRRRRRFHDAAGRSAALDRRCYVLVTPDGERTMNTYLGAAQDLHPADIDADMIAASAILYLEGYLWDPKTPRMRSSRRRRSRTRPSARWR